MKLIVGLGNPGDKYAETRHNVGFRAVKKIADFYNFKKPVFELNALVSSGNIKNEKIFLAQPFSYMNKSGKVVKNLTEYYNISLEQLIIIYDDLDLPVGKMRIKTKGSSGGHNGIKSIIHSLSDQKFPRIKIGIGRPAPEKEVVEYVLDYFDENEEKVMEEVMEEVVKSIQVICEQGFEEAMNRFN